MIVKEIRRGSDGELSIRILRYSPDQPRDEHGRFGEGDGGGRFGTAAAGSAAEAAVPVSATFDEVPKSDRYPTGDRATGFDGATAGRDSVAAVNTYLAQPGLINDRLRNPEGFQAQQSALEALGPNATIGQLYDYYKQQGPDYRPPQSAADIAKADRSIAGLDRVMGESQLSQDIVVYRGVDGAGTRAMGLPSGDATGHVWADAGFVSTSAARGVAESSFSSSQGAVLRVLAPAGTPALSLTALGEHEILLGRGLTYTVTADNGTTSSGARLLDVQVAGLAERRRPGRAET